jgi:hypothetical protein
MKLRLRGGPPAPTESPASASPEAQLPARPGASEPSSHPAVPGESLATGATQATPPPVRLKPRFSIKPSEPERAGETISVPGLPSVLSPIGSAAVGPPETTAEKVKIDLGPRIRPSEAGSPAGAVSAATSLGGEKTEMAFKFKLRPASGGALPESPALPGLADVKPSEVTIIRPAAASPVLPGIPVGKTIPTLVSTEVSTPQKPNRRASLAVLAGLLVVCGACYLWFFGRARKPVTVAHPPVVEAAPHASPGAAADHPVAVSESSGNATTGAPAVSSGETPGALTPVSPSAPTAVHPPPEPTPQFRAFVDHLKINGVRAGPPARLFVDGIACRPGDVLDHDLGVVFDSVDAATSQIIFKDATGAVVRRRF